VLTDGHRRHRALAHVPASSRLNCTRTCRDASADAACCSPAVCPACPPSGLRRPTHSRLPSVVTMRAVPVTVKHLPFGILRAGAHVPRGLRALRCPPPPLERDGGGTGADRAD